jgi:hypothetical protein
MSRVTLAEMIESLTSMFNRPSHRQAPPPSSTRFDSVEQARLRASLRLLFDGETADRIALGAGNVMRAAIRQWTIGSWKSLVGRGSIPSGTKPPLAPARKPTARGAVALALQLGTGATGESLAEMSGASPEQIGIELYQARTAIAHDPTPVCGQFTASLGRYRDPSLDMIDRATLLQHIQRCDACRSAFDRFQAIDAALQDDVDQAAAALDVLGQDEIVARRRRWPTRWQLVSVCGAALLIASVVLVWRLLPSPSGDGNTSAASGPSPELSGWVLMQDNDGQLVALDLSTGRKRPIGTSEILPGNRQNGLGSALLSPDRRLLAGQQPIGSEQPQQQLTIETLSGKVVRSVALGHAWSSLAAWFGSEKVLEIEQPDPRPGESQTDYSKRIQTESTIVAIDVATGQQREIFRGAVAQVFPSPDATMIVIETPSNGNDGLNHLELRKIGGGRADQVIVSSDRGVSGALIWSPDSSRFFVAMAPESEASPTPESADAAAFPRQVTGEMRLASVSSSGQITNLPALPESDFDIPITVSPDGAQLFAAAITGGEGNTNTFRLWRMTSSGEQPTVLTEPSTFVNGDGIWSPDGKTLLLRLYRPFLLTSSVEIPDLGTITNTSFVAVWTSGKTETVRSQLADYFGVNVLGWLPPNALPAASPVANSHGRPDAPVQVDLRDNTLMTDPNAQPSPDGQYVILHNRLTGNPVIWDRLAASNRRLPDGTTDLSWLPDSHILIGVGQTSGGSNGSFDFSRLMTFAPSFNGTVPTYDFRAYDPAGIGSNRNRRYAAPLFSPNENNLAFFVIDDQQGSITLWEANASSQAQAVHTWRVPVDRKIDQATVAAWLDNHTLLFAEQDDWHDGLPRQIRLEQMTINRDGTVAIGNLATLHTHGSEHGINLRELAVDQNSGHIGYRLRHFTSTSASKGSFDSVDIVTMAHIDSPIELSRQGSGSGLSWSPDGSVLAATFPGELRFYSGTGELLGTRGGLIDPTSPRWVSSSEVWFNAEEDRADQILSVTLH